MLLNSIIIENIRSYEHEEIEFPRGISLFEGDIGSGKSTVLMSIEFALFGLGSQKPEALLAKKAERGFVVLDFSVDGERYEIQRTLIRKNAGVNQDPKNSWIKIDGEKEPLSPSELKQRVLQILKFNEPADPKAESRIFRYAIFTPQEAMKEVLSDSKRRLETIRKAFGIEDYSIAASNAKELLNEIKIRSSALQERFSNISELESEISESQKTIADVKKEVAIQSEKKTKLEEKEEVIVSEIKKLQEKNSEKIKIESKKESLEEKIDSAKSEIQKIEDEFAEFEVQLKQNADRLEKLLDVKKPETDKSVAELTAEIKKFQGINDELIGLKSEKKNISENLLELKETLGDKINSDKSSLEGILQDLEKEKDSLQKFADEIKEKQDKVNEQKVQKQTLKGSLENEIAKFSQLGNACPTCKQEITEEHHHSLVGEKQKEVDALDEELNSITDSFFESNSKAKEIQTKLDSYDEEISQIQKILPGIENYAAKSEKLAQIEAKILELQGAQGTEYGENPVEHLSELKDGLVQYEGAAEQIKQIVESKQRTEKQVSKIQSEGENLESELSQNESELKKIESELESFEDFDELISEKETEQGSLRREITSISGVLAASNERINNEQDKIAQNEKKISESRKWQEKFNTVTQYKEWLESFFIPTISMIEKQVLLSILQNFNETYTRWYSILVEDPTKESRIDENFTPIVNQDGYEQEIGFLSGGEKTSIAL
ncbi:MAG: AAA family ATPase, partial [Nitrosopumilaceae archaeon]